MPAIAIDPEGAAAMMAWRPCSGGLHAMPPSNINGSFVLPTLAAFSCAAERERGLVSCKPELGSKRDEIEELGSLEQRGDRTISSRGWSARRDGATASGIR